jgi:hypothetical protein
MGIAMGICSSLILITAGFGWSPPTLGSSLLLLALGLILILEMAESLKIVFQFCFVSFLMVVTIDLKRNFISA